MRDGTPMREDDGERDVAHPDGDTLELFAAGALPTDTEIVVDRHVRGCGLCAGTVAAFKEVYRELEDEIPTAASIASVPGSPLATPAVGDRRPTGQLPDVQGKRERRTFGATAWLTAAAAVLAAAGGVYIVRQVRQPPPSSSGTTASNQIEIYPVFAVSGSRGGPDDRPLLRLPRPPSEARTIRIRLDVEFLNPATPLTAVIETETPVSGPGPAAVAVWGPQSVAVEASRAGALVTIDVPAAALGRVWQTALSLRLRNSTTRDTMASLRLSFY